MSLLGDAVNLERNEDGGRAVDEHGARHEDLQRGRNQPEQPMDRIALNAFGIRIALEGKPSIIATRGIIFLAGIAMIKVIQHEGLFDLAIRRIFKGSVVIELVTEAREIADRFKTMVTTNKFLPLLNKELVECSTKPDASWIQFDSAAELHIEEIQISRDELNFLKQPAAKLIEIYERELQMAQQSTQPDQALSYYLIDVMSSHQEPPPTTESSFKHDNQPTGQVNAARVYRSNIAGRDFVQNIYYTFSSSQKSSQRSPRQSISRDSGTDEAIQKLKRIQKKRREDILFLPTIFEVNAVDVATVHPKIQLEDFYKGAKLDTSYEPQPKTRKEIDEKSLISFEQLQEAQMEHRFVALIGQPGSGKTITSQRLVNVDADDIKLCFRLELRRLSLEKCTLRQLLIDNTYRDLDEKECELIFKWVRDNEKHCSIIMDGFDQLPWTLEDAKLTEERYETPLTPKQLIANLFGKLFLSDIHIVLTSRHQAMLKIRPELRPKKTVLLQGLSDEDMKTLFKTFAGESASKLMQYLRDTTPVLLDLCHNPLMLVFTVWAFLDEDLTKASAIRTVTGMFSVLLQKLKRFENARSTDLEQITEQLSKLAWDATNKETIEITNKDLDAVKLTPKDVQDLVFAAVGRNVADQKLFDGDVKLYFVHQTWQEYFSALRLTKYVKNDIFENSVRAIVEDWKWSTVRRFVCGQLLNTSMTEVFKGPKSSVFFKMLKTWFKELIKENSYDDRLELIDFLVDLLECSDDVAKEFAKEFEEDIILNDVTLDPSMAHGLSRLLRLRDKSVIILDLHNCYPNLQSLKQICDAIIAGPYMIDTLNLGFNHFEDAAAEIICTVMPKIRKELIVRAAFLSGEGHWKDPSNEVREILRAGRFECGNHSLVISRAGGKI